jgi:hypothetical protein
MRAAPRSYGLSLRPGLYGATADWRRIAGPERRPHLEPPSGSDRWAPAWLELQCWWRYAFWACREADTWRAVDLCIKLVAEPARTFLWIEHGVRCGSRREALERALALLPEEEPVLELALHHLRTLPHIREAPLASTLGYLVRVSQRLAERLEVDAAKAGATTVRLLLGRDEQLTTGGPLPLVDWRARVYPSCPDEYLLPLAGEPTSPADLGEAARCDTEAGPRPALLTSGLLVLPTFDLETRPLIRGALRAVQSAGTDPVTFALLAHEQAASFPQIPGLSARDSALRAAASHEAWLEHTLAAASPLGRSGRGMLLSSARAAIFVESLCEGDPELPLTVEAIVEGLSAREPALAPAAEHVADGYRTEAEDSEWPQAACALASALAERLRRTGPQIPQPSVRSGRGAEGSLATPAARRRSCP